MCRQGKLTATYHKMCRTLCTGSDVTAQVRTRTHKHMQTQISYAQIYTDIDRGTQTDRQTHAHSHTDTHTHIFAIRQLGLRVALSGLKTLYVS